jgi:hypothetical protein
VPSTVFTLILGVLAGIAALGGATPLEMVLILGVLGLAHMTVVAGREVRQTAPGDSQRVRD